MMNILYKTYLSSRPEVFCKKGVPRNFAKFTGKDLHQSLFYNEVEGIRPTVFTKKETLAQAFSCEFCKILKNTIFHGTPPVAACIRTITSRFYVVRLITICD